MWLFELSTKIISVWDIVEKKLSFDWEDRMKTLIKYLALFCGYGLIYLDMEIFSRAIRHDIHNINGNEISYLAFAGWTSLWMFFIGGAIGVILGLLDERRHGYTQPWYRIRVIAGIAIIYCIEFISGYILNVRLNMHLWNYTDPLNIAHQITLMYLPIWFVLSVFAQWLDDVVRYWFEHSRPWPGNFFQAMANVFRR